MCIRDRLQDSNNIQLQEEYRTLNREVKKQVANKKNETWTKKCEYIERYIGGTRSSEARRNIRSLRNSNTNKTHIGSISSKQWKQHFEDLLVESRKQFIEVENPEETMEKDNIVIEVSEIADVVEILKNGTSAGIGGIYPELVKYAPAVSYTHLIA